MLDSWNSGLLMARLSGEGIPQVAAKPHHATRDILGMNGNKPLYISTPLTSSEVSSCRQSSGHNGVACCHTCPDHLQWHSEPPGSKCDLNQGHIQSRMAATIHINPSSLQLSSQHPHQSSSMANPALLDLGFPRLSGATQSLQPGHCTGLREGL